MSEPADSRYRRARAWLASRPDFELASPGRQQTTSFPLERPARLLERLGRPDHGRGIILIAGTKGKGSTAVLTAAILEAHGSRVGLYTQPHLHSFRERLRINGKLISKQEFAEEIERIIPVVAELDAAAPELGPLTAYEITTMLGLNWFARRGADWVVLEVGLGGRLDATNVVTPDLAIITPISYDHTHILGRTLGAIAGEKAGIIKPGQTVVSAPQRPAAQRVIRRVARERGATLVEAAGPAPNVTPLRLRADAPTLPVDPYFQLQLPRPGRPDLQLELHLGGLHQVDNLCTALTGLGQLGLDLADEAIERGVAAARWPGRLELVRTAPLLVLDGAHNGASVQALDAALRLHFNYRRLHLVLGVLADKDLGAILRAPRRVHSLVAVTAASPRARPAAEIAALAKRLGLPAETAEKLADGLALAVGAADPLDLVCVTGSLTVVAEARPILGLDCLPDVQVRP